MQQFAQYVCAVLAIVAGTGAIAIAGVTWLAPRSSPARWATVALKRRNGISLAVAGVAVAGSLYFSEVADLVPCRLCWFQRVFMYPLVVIALVAVLRRDRDARWYLAALAGVGLAISTYHNLIELRPELDTGSCALFGPACNVVYFRTFGLSLASMAWLGFASILLLNIVMPPSSLSQPLAVDEPVAKEHLR